MKRIKITYFTLLLGVFISSMFAFKANSQTFTFELDDFIVVDSTATLMVPNGSFAKLADTNSNGDTIRKYYRLTEIRDYQTIAMWHSQKLDLQQDFIFNCKLFFDKGKSNHATIADGICFVLHRNQGSLSNLIGGKEFGIGYSGILNSFAVEFDTEHNLYIEGGMPPMQHISYLKDGSMAALDGTYNPMQNNMYYNSWYDVTDSNWYCVSIVWKRTNGMDGSAGYDMLTYMQEKHAQAQMDSMVLRSSMHFNTLSDLVTGLTTDANGQALVTWGITSATCDAPNRHMIEFNSMENSNVLFGDITIHVENMPIEHYALKDVTVESGCGTMITVPNTKPDTIYYLHPICATHNPIVINIPGVNTVLSNWSVFRGDGYVSSSNNCSYIAAPTREPYNYDVAILLTDTILSNYDTIWVRLIRHGDTTYFVFNHIVSPDSTLVNYFADSLGFENNRATIDTPFQSIPLPSGLPDSCIVVTTSVDSVYYSPFLDTPRVVNGKLEFKLADTVFCSGLNYVTINLQNTCDVCNNDYVALTFNWSCDSCDNVKFTFEPSPDQWKWATITGYYSGKIQVRTTNGKSIVQADLTRPNGTLLTTYGNGTDSLDVPVSMPCTCDTTTASFPICATLEDGLICCDTVYVTYNCCDKVYEHIDTIPTCVSYDYGTKKISIIAALLQLPDPISPLRISICSQSGDEVMLVSNTIPTELVSNFEADLSNLVYGMYYVVFQIEDETYAILFIKQ